MELENSLSLLAFPSLSPLVRAYLSEEKSIRHLYEHEFSLDGFADAIEKKKSFSHRTVLADVLTQQYHALPRHEKTLANIELLREENTFTITAAHQPALFLGPLFNLFKISGTIVTARLLKEKYPQYNFVPVFWLGSEDHDKEELCHTFVDETKIDWQTEQTGAVGRFSLERLREKVEELKTLTHIESHPLLDVLDTALSRTKNFGQLTQFLATELFKDFGLVVLNSDDANLKRLFLPIVEDEILNNRAEKTLEPTIHFLEENYTAQAKPRNINFFYLTDNARERIVRKDEGVSTVNGLVFFDHLELKKTLQEHPERFSPNVFFRPLYQEFILPNLAFIGGGGELGYWLELKPLFEFHHIPYPMLIHRNMGSVQKKNLYEKAGKLKLELPDFFTEKQTLIKQWITENAQHDISIDDEKSKLNLLYETLLQKAVNTDKTLESSVKAEQQKAINTLENLHAKITKAEKRNQETSLNQIENIYKKLFPNGTLAERSDNVTALGLRLTADELNKLILAQNPFEKNFQFFSY